MYAAPPMPDALCATVDPDVFFPPEPTSTLRPYSKGTVKLINQAKAICSGCPELNKCLSYALSDPELVGVWGGTSTREREAMRTVQVSIN